MRVLEPHYFESIKRRKKTRRFPKKLLVFAVLFILGSAAYVVFGQDALSDLVARPSRQSTNEQQQTEAETIKPRVLKTFTSEEFKSLYSSFVYPNTQAINQKPEITGYPEVDEQIRKVAEARGYKLTAVPVASIVKTGEPGLEGDDLMQPNALMAWQSLKAAAIKDGIKLKLTSAYRSIDYQRSLFLRRMKDSGVTVYTIADGNANDELDTVLSRAALPGYSRHHTGYTIDLSCDGIGLEAFVRTSCYGWLSKNNFENAKIHGWVPSYPEGVTLNGPEPESWEYIWVGTDAVYE